METTAAKPSGGMKILDSISAALMIIIGISLVLTPRLVVWMFFAAVYINGIQLIIRYFSMKEGRSGWDIIAGIINLIFGSMMLFGDPEARIMGVMTVETFIAVWALFAGFTHIFGSFGLRRLDVKNWYWVLIRGILTVVCGVMFLAIPMISAMGMVFAVGVYAGAMFILSGFTGLAGALSGNKTDQ